MELDPRLRDFFESADDSKLPELLKSTGRTLEEFEGYVQSEGLQEKDIDPEIREAVAKIRKAFAAAAKLQQPVAEKIQVVIEGPFGSLPELKGKVVNYGAGTFVILRKDAQKIFQGKSKISVRSGHTGVGLFLVRKAIDWVRTQKNEEVQIELAGKNATIKPVVGRVKPGDWNDLEIKVLKKLDIAG